MLRLSSPDRISSTILSASGADQLFGLLLSCESAAFVGLKPRQYSTSGKAQLPGIIKRGNSFLRKLLIYGAQAAIICMKRERTG